MHDESKRRQPERAQRCSHCIERGRLPSTHNADRAITSLLLFLMTGDERQAGRQDCGKCEKETAERWAIQIGDDTGGSGDEGAEGKSRRELSGTRLPQTCQINRDAHV